VHYLATCPPRLVHYSGNFSEKCNNVTRDHLHLTAQLNTLRTGDANLRFYLTTAQDG